MARPDTDKFSPHLPSAVSMDTHTFQFLRKLIYKHSRIDLGEQKRELLQARISKRLRTTGILHLSDYCLFIQTVEGSKEIPHLIDAVSTNHTYFFREEAHFAFLRETLIPLWLANHKNGSHLNIWSAACSSGEEPYSIALVLQETLGKANPNLHWHILATDISHRILTKAKNAVYPAAALQKLPHASRSRYFLSGYDKWADHYRVRPEITAKIEFRQMNLLGTDPVSRDFFDLICCRNVMIYFNHETREELVRKLSHSLKPGGYLFIGHSESLSGIRHDLLPVMASIYRKAG